MSGAEINDDMSASDDDSPRRNRSGSGIATGMNPSVVTLGAKRGGASVPGTGVNTNDSHIRGGAGGLAQQSSKMDSFKSGKYHLNNQYLNQLFYSHADSQNFYNTVYAHPSGILTPQH